MTNRDIIVYKVRLDHFKKHPSSYNGLSLFIAARRCGKEITEDILEAISPVISERYNQMRHERDQSIKKHSEKYSDNSYLLAFALENETLKEAFDSFREFKKTKAIEDQTLRKRLQRHLESSLKNILQSRPHIEKLNIDLSFTGSDTKRMLELYRLIDELEDYQD